MSSVTLLGSLILIGVGVLQSTVLRFIEIAGVSPDLVLIVVVFIANKNGTMSGQVVGFAGGLVLDLLGLAPLGFFALVYTLVGALYGVTRGKMFVDPILFPVVFAIIGEIIKGLIALVVAALFSVHSVRDSLFSSSYLIEIGYTALAAPILFAVLGLLPWLQPDRRRGEMMS